MDSTHDLIFPLVFASLISACSCEDFESVVILFIIQFVLFFFFFNST